MSALLPEIDELQKGGATAKAEAEVYTAARRVLVRIAQRLNILKDFNPDQGRKAELLASIVGDASDIRDLMLLEQRAAASDEWRGGVVVRPSITYYNLQAPATKPKPEPKNDWPASPSVVVGGSRPKEKPHAI